MIKVTKQNIFELIFQRGLKHVFRNEANYLFSVKHSTVVNSVVSNGVFKANVNNIVTEVENNHSKKDINVMASDIYQVEDEEKLEETVDDIETKIENLNNSKVEKNNANQDVYDDNVYRMSNFLKIRVKVSIAGDEKTVIILNINEKLKNIKIVLTFDKKVVAKSIGFKIAEKQADY